ADRGGTDSPRVPRAEQPHQRSSVIDTKQARKKELMAAPIIPWTTPAKTRIGANMSAIVGNLCWLRFIGTLKPDTSEFKAIEITNTITATARWRPRSARNSRQPARSASFAPMARATQLVIAFLHQLDVTMPV